MPSSSFGSCRADCLEEILSQKELGVVKTGSDKAANDLGEASAHRGSRTLLGRRKKKPEPKRGLNYLTAGLTLADESDDQIVYSFLCVQRRNALFVS